MRKNETLRMVTMLALIINVVGFVLAMKYGLEGFDVKYFIIWAISLIWIVLFTLANCFIKSRKNNKNKIAKNRNFKVYNMAK